MKEEKKKGQTDLKNLVSLSLLKRRIKVIRFEGVLYHKTQEKSMD
jgi:hypothetical protein